MNGGRMAMPGKQISREQEVNSKVLFLTAGYMKSGWEFVAREMALRVRSCASSVRSIIFTRNSGNKKKGDRYFFSFFKKFTDILQFFYTSVTLEGYTIFKIFRKGKLRGIGGRKATEPKGQIKNSGIFSYALKLLCWFRWSAGLPITKVI
jgi:hypothetical protein